MTPEEMKQQWGELSARIDKLENLNRKTAIDRLRERYRRFIIMALLCGGSSTLIMLFSSTHIIDPWQGLAFAVLMGLCVIEDFILWHRVSDMDLQTMGVAEIADRALRCRRFHNICVVVNLPLALAWVGWIAVSHLYEKFFIAGIAVGIVLGLIVGLTAYFRFMDDYRALGRKQRE